MQSDFEQWVDLFGNSEYDEYLLNLPESTTPTDRNTWLIDHYYERLAEQHEYERDAYYDNLLERGLSDG